MMDPIQLQLMQEMSAGNIPGVSPGQFAPAVTGGVGMLQTLASGYAPPILGTPLPDVSPLAQLNLQQYGPLGMLAGIAGNPILSNMLYRQGLLPMGNAGSYMQAYRTREHLMMRQQVSQALAQQDAAGIYRTIRGAAALAGMPLSQAQQQAARGLAQTAADTMPIMAMLYPEMADAVSGERGSVQAMAGQIMEANRYRIDPFTGRMGFGQAANHDLIQQVFGTMFADDNMAKMRGLRAGDVGQLYRQLAAEGMSGPNGGLRDRTIQALQYLRDSGADLNAIAKSQNVTLATGQNLQTLTNTDLGLLRQDDAVKTQLTKSDARQITDRLQGYVNSVAAIREVLGENGNPNAPMPALINALKALTSGQMQKFDANQLNNIVRDMQALSQLSGKSIDQLVSMGQTASASNAQLLGPYGIYFDPAATRVGVTTGMAMAERGGITGFGALNREEAEQASMNMFSRGMGSTMGNALGALTRIEEAGGFANNAAGREMVAALQAADAGEETYTFFDDQGNPVSRRTPTRENQFRGIVARGAIQGMNVADFNQMLGDRTSNLRALAANPTRQAAPMQQQPYELNSLTAMHVAARLLSNRELTEQVSDPKRLAGITESMGLIVAETADSLTLEQLQNPQQRNQMLADALKVVARNNGVSLTNETALNMAAESFGQRETVLQARAGMDATGYAMVQGKQVRESRREQQALVAAQASQNKAMAGLGPKGTLMQRLFTAVQRQGDRGTSADLSTLLGDLFAVDMDQAAQKLNPLMQKIGARNATIEALKTKLAGASPAERAAISKQIEDESRQLEKEVSVVGQLADSLGLIDKEKEFNREDVAEGLTASRELEQFTLMQQAQTLSLFAPVSDEERKAVAGTSLTAADFRTLATVERQKRLANASKTAEEVIGGKFPKSSFAKNYKTRLETGATAEFAKKQLIKDLEGEVGSAEQIAEELQQLYGDGTVESLKDPAAIDALVRSRRIDRDMLPTNDQIVDRVNAFRKSGTVQAAKSEEELAKLTEAERRAYGQTEHKARQQAESQLLAENQLKALGYMDTGDTLLGKLDKMRLPPELLASLQRAKPEDRAAMVAAYITRQQETQFLGSNAAEFALRQSAVRSSLGTETGKQRAQLAEQNFSAMANVRQEYLADTEAVLRGGDAGLAAARRSQDAEMELQQLSNTYYQNVGNMLLSNGVAMSAKGETQAEKEFAALSVEQKDAIAKQLGLSGSDALTVGDYHRYIGKRVLSAKQNMMDAANAMGKAAELPAGLTAEQASALATLTKLSTQDVSKAAKDLKMSEDDYRKAIKDPRSLQELGLRLFAKPEELSQAKQIALDLANAKDRKAKLDALPLSQRTARHAEMVQAEQDRISRLEGENSQMRAKTNAASQDQYLLLLDNQDRVDVLEQQRKNYAEAHLQLEAGSMTPAQADALLEEQNKKRQQQSSQLQELRGRDPGGDDLVSLAKAFGITDDAGIQKFKEKFDRGGDVDRRTRQMVTNVLKKFKSTPGGPTAVDKLSQLTHEYAQVKTQDARQQLVEKWNHDEGLNIGLTDLDSMMAQTSFLRMDKGGGKFNQEDLRARLDAVAGVDMYDDTKKQQERTIRIVGGEIEIKGDFKGTGSIGTMTGIYTN